MYDINHHVATIAFPIIDSEDLVVISQWDEFHADSFLQVVHAMRLLQNSPINEVVYPVLRDTYFVHNSKIALSHIMNTKPRRIWGDDELIAVDVHCDKQELWITYFHGSKIRISETIDLEELYTTINRRMAKREQILVM